MMSDLCGNDELSRVERFTPRRASAGSEREVIHAGTMPKITPVKIDTSKEKPNTGSDGVALIDEYFESGKAKVRIVRVPAYATASPSAPPMQPKSTLSTIICRIRRERAAPRAMRSDVSVRLAVPLARRMLAMFAQATSRTSA